MQSESLKSELLRLREEQTRALRDEGHGGLSAQERAAYDDRKQRIRELEEKLRALRNSDPTNSF